MREFRFLLLVIVLLEALIFACGVRVVYNRHNARSLFIELEREQQVYNALLDERSQLKVELATLEQPANIEKTAKQAGLIPVENRAVVVINLQKQAEPKVGEVADLNAGAENAGNKAGEGTAP